MRKTNDQLCWTCKNAYAGKCPWFTKYEPVDGWTARQTEIKTYDEKSTITSYEITACPNYEPENFKHIRKTTLIYNNKNYEMLTRFEKHIIEQLLNNPCNKVAKRYNKRTEFITKRLEYMLKKLTSIK